MKPALLFLAVLTLAGCKPSKFFGSPNAQEELLGGNTDAVGGFPAGSWEDGLGNVWTVTVDGDSVASSGASPGLDGLSKTGTIDGDTLTYSIGAAEQDAVANGTARLIDAEHAWFKTLNADGSLNAHGLFHFNHSAQVPILPNGDLPVPNCANPTLQGD